MDPFDRSILTHSVTENDSLEGVPRLGAFNFLKTAVEPASEMSCSINNLVDGQSTKKEGYIEDFTVHKTYVSFSNITFI